MKQVTLNISPRTEFGSSAANSLRKGGQVPAVVYGESGHQSLTVNAHEFGMAFRDFAGRVALLELKQEGEDSIYAIIQEMQRHAVTDEFLHIDFKEIVRGKEMETDIPVQTLGTADGVRNYGGVLEVSANTLRVRCRPRDLPEYIIVDVKSLGIGKTIRLSDIEAPEGVTFLDDPETVLVGCVGATLEIGEESQTDEVDSEAADASAEESKTEASEE